MSPTPTDEQVAGFLALTNGTDSVGLKLTTRKALQFLSRRLRAAAESPVRDG